MESSYWMSNQSHSDISVITLLLSHTVYMYLIPTLMAFMMCFFTSLQRVYSSAVKTALCFMSRLLPLANMTQARLSTSPWPIWRPESITSKVSKTNWGWAATNFRCFVLFFRYNWITVWKGNRDAARLPPMWPWFDSGPMAYVDWVCWWFSVALLRGLFSGFSGFPLSTKTNSPNSNSADMVSSLNQR